MKERTKEELLIMLNDPYRKNTVLHEIIDQLIAEMEKPKVWDGAPEWAMVARVEWADTAYLEFATRREYSDIHTRTLPKTRAREIAEEVTAMWQRCDPSFSGMSHADTIEAAILRREKELEEGR